MGGSWAAPFLHIGGLCGVLGDHGPQNPPRPDFYLFLLDFGWLLGGFCAPRAAQNLIFELPDAPRISIIHALQGIVCSCVGASPQVILVKSCSFLWRLTDGARITRCLFLLL